MAHVTRPIVGQLGGADDTQITGMFRTEEDADRAVAALKDAGFEDQSFSIVPQQNVFDKQDLREDDDEPATGTRQGDILVIVNATGQRINVAMNIMRSAGATQVEGAEEDL